MSQFDVYRHAGDKRTPLLLDVQADVLAVLPTRLVVPLRAFGRGTSKPLTRLNPIVDIAGTAYIAVFQELAAVPAAMLATRVSSAATQRDALIAAIDWAFTGT